MNDVCDQRNPVKFIMTEEKRATCSRLCNTRTSIYILAGLSVIVLINMLNANNHLTSIIDLSKQVRDGFKELLSYNDSSIEEIASPNRPYIIAAIQSDLNRTDRKTLSPKSTTSTPKPTTTTTKVTTKPTTKSNPAQPTPRPDDCKACFEHNFKYIIDNEHICDTGNGKSNVDIAVFILTVHANRKARDTLRETWLTPTKNNTAEIRYAFLLGSTPDQSLQKKVEEENAIFHDIIQEDFVDKYMNLTYKTIMAFKWASTKCKQAKFIMKTDDDMFVNLNSVKNVVAVHGSSLQTAVGGACHMSAGPIRDRNSKWYASKISYPRNSYPGFCSGTGYVTSMNVASKIYEVSRHVPFFHLEDVYVALCIKRLGYKLKPIAGFNSGRTPPGCAYKTNNVVTSHYLGLDLIRKMWNLKC